MSRRGSDSLSSGPGKCFAFIDADNVASSYINAFKNRKLAGEATKYFSLEILLRRIPAYRKYLFSAAPEGKDTHEWLVKLRAEQSFIYRQGKLIEKEGKTPKQQGVDVMIAVEALKCAHSKVMESCIVFSNDGDLLPLVSALVDLGIHTTVFGFGDPSIGKVAQDLQDACDNYVHIGDSILALASLPSGMPSMSGNCTRSMFASFGALESFEDDANSHAIAYDANGGLYVSNLPLEEMKHYTYCHYVYFEHADAAFARYRLVGSFF